MRRLVLTRGAPGSGKSTALGRLGLTDYLLNPDAIRVQLAGPVLTPEGRLELDQSRNSRVWKVTLDLLEQRMARGELTGVDATHPNGPSFAPYRELCTRYRYAAVCLDFTTVPEPIVHANNERREPHRTVPPPIVQRILDECARGRPPESLPRISWRADGTHLTELDDWLAEPDLPLDVTLVVGGPYDLGPSCKPGIALLSGDEPVPENAVLSVADFRRPDVEARDAIVLRAGPARILITPGPLPCIPDRLERIASQQLAEGVGPDPELAFDRWASEQPGPVWHLHRGPRSGERSLSLREGPVLVQPDGHLERLQPWEASLPSQGNGGMVDG